MKKNRIIYSVLLVGALVLSYKDANFFTALITYSLLVTPLISLLYISYIYRRFTYSQEVDKKFITKGERIKFSFYITNETALFYPDIEVVFYGVEGVLKKYFTSKRLMVPEYGSKAYEYEVECKYRGYYEMGIQKIYITDFLGLIRLPYRVFAPRYLTVYPRIVPLQYFPVGYYTVDENESILYGMAGKSALTDIKTYQYGDSLKTIHWKLTASKQQLMVRKNESTASAKTYVLLDLEKNDFSIEMNTILEDQLVECAVAIIYYCLRRFIPVEWVDNYERMSGISANQLNDFTPIYEALFQLKFESQLTLAEVLSKKRDISLSGSHIVLITSHLTYSLYEQIKYCVLEGSNVVLVYVSPEKVVAEPVSYEKVILQAVEDLGVKYYKVDIGDDLDHVFSATSFNHNTKL